MNKKELRKYMLNKRLKLNKEYILDNSNIIVEKIINSDFFKKAKTIMTYSDFKSEVSTETLNKLILKNDKKLLLPKINNNIIVPIEYSGKFSKNKFGINELIGEICTSKIDLIIVPGLVFDKNGHRIGYGKAYYDKFLSELNYNVLKLGICYDFQIIDEIAYESTDIQMDMLISENKCIVFNNII